ncbi:MULTISPECIES: DUF1559 domain-containing protein [Rhodopirellula]|uniref:DUF1559 domain-containing protein n=1 Tax=Rhodopirellula TaxID=265488 RepID=UPI00257973A2|nr:DUF1559 domain-containing protein [Rhodopirellula sp. UBA1907]
MNIRHLPTKLTIAGRQSHFRPGNRMFCNGFTLVELLVVIAIIGVLVGLSAPALQSIRETTRRAACQSKLVPIGLAIQSYHDRWMHFPVGTVLAPEGGISGPIESTAEGNHHNWLGRLMDLLDQPVVANRIDRSVSVYDEANQPVLQLRLPLFRCPSSEHNPDNASNYVGLHHPTEKAIDESDHGVFILNVAITRDDVTDGLANTAFVSEKLLPLDDLGWLSGTRATLRNVGGGIETSMDRFAQPVASAVGSVGSRHPVGAHFLFGSGEVRFQASETDPRILEQIVDRRDGQLPMHFQSIETLREQSLK